MATSRRAGRSFVGDETTAANKEAVLAAGETSARLAGWLEEHGHKEVSSEAKRGVPRVPTDPPMLAAYRHLMSPDHDRNACRACVVTSIIFRLDSHTQETAAWTTALEFARDVEHAAHVLDVLESRAVRRVASLSREAETAESGQSSGRYSREEGQRARSVDGCEALGRLLRYAREEMRRLAVGQVAAFESPDHRVLAKANPPRPLIKDITRALAGVGFTASEIAHLVDDGHGVVKSSRSQKDAVARVRKRLVEPASKTPKPKSPTAP